MVVTTQGQGEPLRLAIVVEQLLVLVTQMINHILVGLCAVGKLLESLGGAHGPGHELGAGALLKHVLLVTEVMFPLVEAVAEVGLLMLLTICEEVKPVADNLAHLNVLPPSVEHLGLQIVICAVPMLPSSD